MSDERSSVLGGTYTRPGDRSASIRFRRALTLTLMTLVMPGSAQLVMGNKRVGRIAVRVWLAFLAAGLFLVFLTLTSRTGLFSLMTNPTLLGLGRLVLLAGAGAWVLLLVDAWRLGAPLELNRSHRLAMTGVNGFLCFVTAGTMLFAAHLVNVQKQFIGTVFTADTVSKPSDGRYNVLLLGGDSGPNRSGLRPDSITLASIDKDTGRTVLIGIPRNLQDAPFTPGTVMAKQWPHGFNCDTCEINAVNTWANDHKSLFPATDKDPGMDATIDAVENTTGLKVSYYALINMHGFASLVDAVGGVTVNVRARTAIGGIGSPIRGYVPAGVHHLNGDQALWYSRSRVQTDDWHRMARQKCVMNDMLHQLSPKTVLLHAQQIAKSSSALFTTSIPQADLATFMDLALKAKTQKVSTVSLVPPAIYTGNPSFPKIHSMVKTAIAKAEGVSTTPVGLTDARLTTVKAVSADEPYDVTKSNQSSDLSESC